jgi:hypothetical protein
MAKKPSTIALMIFLAGSSVLTVGRTLSTQSQNDAATTKTKTESHFNDNHGKKRQACSTGGNKKDKKKTKRDAKPTPSREEQEFERMLLGTFG